MRHCLLLVLALVTGLVLTGCNGPSPEAKTVTVYADAAVSDALRAGARVFRQTRTVTEVRVQPGGSNDVVDRLTGGAQGDALVVPETGMKRAQRAGLISGGVWTVARDGLVLVVAKGNPLDITGLDSIGEDVGLALCDDADPCASEARELADDADVRLKPGSRGRDARAVRDMVATGKEDVGITYASVAATHPDGIDVIPLPGAERVVRVQAALLADSRSPGPAEDFVKFLASPQGQAALRERGFTAP